MQQWTHKYRYKLKFPYPRLRIGEFATGVVQVGREFTPEEVEKLAKEMAHGSMDDATLVECCLVEVRVCSSPA